MRLSQSPHRSYLLANPYFWRFLPQKKRDILRIQKTSKMRIYEQVSLMCRLWYSQKLTCKKFEVSDFWNFEKIFKIRFNRQKSLIFTPFFLTKTFTSTFFFSERSRSGAWVALVCGEFNDFSGAARSGAGSFRSDAPKKERLRWLLVFLEKRLFLQKNMRKQTILKLKKFRPKTLRMLLSVLLKLEMH